MKSNNKMELTENTNETTSRQENIVINIAEPRISPSMGPTWNLGVLLV